MKRTLWWCDLSLNFFMKKRIIKRFLNVIGREEKGMKPIVLKFGLALALTFAGFVYCRIRVRRIKPSPTSPRRHPSGLFLLHINISLFFSFFCSMMNDESNWCFVCMMSFSGQGSDVNSGGSTGAASSSCSTISEANIQDTVSYMRKEYLSACFISFVILIFGMLNIIFLLFFASQNLGTI